MAWSDSSPRADGSGRGLFRSCGDPLGTRCLTRRLARRRPPPSALGGPFGPGTARHRRTERSARRQTPTAPPAPPATPPGPCGSPGASRAAITGAPTFAKPDGSPRLRSVIRVPPRRRVRQRVGRLHRERALGGAHDQPLARHELDDLVGVGSRRPRNDATNATPRPDRERRRRLPRDRLDVLVPGGRVVRVARRRRRPPRAVARSRSRSRRRPARRSLRPEDPVPGVAEPGPDVAALVQPAVQRRDGDRDVGLDRADRLDALRRRDQARRGAGRARRPRAAGSARRSPSRRWPASGRRRTRRSPRRPRAATRSSRRAAASASLRRMPRWPTAASGTKRRNPSTMPEAGAQHRDDHDRPVDDAPDGRLQRRVRPRCRACGSVAQSPRRRASPPPRTSPSRNSARGVSRRAAPSRARRARGGRRRGLPADVPGTLPVRHRWTPAPQRRAQGARPRPGARRWRAALGHGATDQGVLRQRDTYFARAATGRLKLRERGRRRGARADRLRARRRRRPRAPAAYHLVDVPDPAALTAALDATLGTRRRRASGGACCSGRTCASTSTTVDGLGRCVELEAVAPAGLRPGATSTRKVAELREVARHRPTTDSSPTGYAAMLLDAGRRDRPRWSTSPARRWHAPTRRTRDFARRRRAARRGRRAARRRQRRERRLPAGPVRGGVGDRRAGRRRRPPDRGGRRDGRHRAHRALRRLPPAPARVRRPRHAGPPRAARGRPRGPSTLGELLPRVASDDTE